MNIKSLLIIDDNEDCTTLDQKLTRSNQELEQFASLVSHDLKQPLQSLFGFAKFIANYYLQNLDEKGAEAIAYIRSAGSRMNQLINDSLTYSKVGAQNPEFKPIDCNLVISRVLDDLQLAIQEQQAKIVYDALPIIST